MGWDAWRYLIFGTLFWGTIYGVMSGGFSSKFFPAFLNGIMWAIPFIAIAIIGEIFDLFKRGEDKK
jgi:hypothetical protein